MNRSWNGDLAPLRDELNKLKDIDITIYELQSAFHKVLATKWRSLHEKTQLMEELATIFSGFVSGHITFMILTYYHFYQNISYLGWPDFVFLILIILALMVKTLYLKKRTSFEAGKFSEFGDYLNYHVLKGLSLSDHERTQLELFITSQVTACLLQVLKK